MNNESLSQRKKFLNFKTLAITVGLSLSTVFIGGCSDFVGGISPEQGGGNQKLQTSKEELLKRAKTEILEDGNVSTLKELFKHEEQEGYVTVQVILPNVIKIDILEIEGQTLDQQKTRAIAIKERINKELRQIQSFIGSEESGIYFEHMEFINDKRICTGVQVEVKKNNKNP